MDSDSEDEYVGNGTPAPVLKLMEDPTSHLCKIDHIRLGDDGCRRLFRWLKTGTEWSDDEDNNGDGKHEDTPRIGFPRSLSHLELTGVRMGDAGFDYLVDWLRYLSLQDQVREGVVDRPMLKTLILRSNKVQGSPQSAQDFISVSSSLMSLGLSNNPLSPAFRQTFLPLLPKLQCLRILDLSLTQIELSDVDALASYIGDTSTKCKLTQFIANANSMEYPGIKTLIASIENCWTLEKVDMFGNVTGQDFNREEEMEQNLADFARCAARISADFLVSVQSAMNLTWGSGCGHIGLETKLKLILGRNIILKQRVKSQALELLKYSRVMLYNRAKSPAPTSASQETSCSEECECVLSWSNRPLPTSPESPQRPSSFASLPTELQLSILSEIAPILSPAQKIRIFEYATDKATLPKLRLCLPNRRLNSSRPNSSKTCVIDPTSLAFSTNFASVLSLPGKKVGNLSSASRETHRKNACAGGNCFGSHSVVCRRQIELKEWLELVECDAYHPGDAI